ncbi:MAG: SPOR domain-containing protein, partial [Alphaproteobacteria bacterium]|nr:SPOR domain-containing protein [Alphaproteobacteria bacterium]
APPRPLFGAGPVPASNTPYGGPVQTPAGYARVWDDGRINPLRGKRVVQATPFVSSRSVAPAAVQAPATAAGHRYVQVGSFGDPANAARLIARLQAAGLPVASAKSGGLKTIAAGPFRSSGDLSRALGIVRGMGFSDAFLRG